MAPGYLLGIGFLAAAWGSSYLFIELALDDLAPAALMGYRFALAALVLGALLVLRAGPRRAVAELRALGAAAPVLGVLNGALPFGLIAWGQTRIDSGTAAIVNASVPLFVLLLAWRFRPSERVGGARLAGVLVGLLGVAVLVGVAPEGGWHAVPGTLAVLASSLCFAASNLVVQQRLATATPLAAAVATVGIAALLLAPFAVVQAPPELPRAAALGAIAGLALLGTGAAQLVLYRLLPRYGSARTSLVTYLVPPVALAYGAAILSEPVTLTAVLGLVLILAGVALGSGLARVSRRPTAVAP
ncbi:MAG: DMT family transporter [Thermoleophilia bacterium]